jgi:hypothetical protein
MLNIVTPEISHYSIYCLNESQNSRRLSTGTTILYFRCLNGKILKIDSHNFGTS